MKILQNIESSAVRGRRSVATLAAITVLTLSCAVILAGKGGGKGGGGSDNTTTKDQTISGQTWFDDVHPIDGLPNGVIADDVNSPYVDGTDRVSIQVGAEHSIGIHLNTQTRKASIRYALFNGGFPAVTAPPLGCAPVGVVQTDARPLLQSGVPGEFSIVPLTFIQIFGAHHDDSAPGVVRHVNARFGFLDDAGQSWAIHYGTRPLYSFSYPDGFYYAPCGTCIAVERLPNTALGASQWRFATEPQGLENAHLGYLYLQEFSGQDPRPIFAGVVDLSWSGLIESLTVEPEPSSSGYTVPEVPAECP